MEHPVPRQAPSYVLTCSAKDNLEFGISLSLSEVLLCALQRLRLRDDVLHAVRHLRHREQRQRLLRIRGGVHCALAANG